MKKISKNPITNKDYFIPDALDDIASLKEFIEEHPDKPIIVVQGLGFVGSVMSLVCANAINGDYAVIGVDLPTEESYWKIASINDGFFPVVSSDPKVKAYFEETRKKRNFYATYDNYAYQLADVIIVDINLDVQKESTQFGNLIDYEVDLSSFKSAIKAIGKNAKEKVLILVETTVPPGATKLAAEIIDQEYSKRGISSENVSIGHSYERVMPGPNYIDSIQNFFRVYAGVDDKSANEIESFLRTIIRTDEYPLTRLGNTNATEISKVLENSYRAMNISFIVEWTRFAEEAGVNLYEVINAIRMRTTHKNIMLPGIGVGGYCLTKDPLLASWARQNLINADNDMLAMSEMAVRTNDKMPLHAFEFLESFYGKEKLKGKKIQLYGVSYLAGVGDTRYTPVANFYKLLIEHESIVSLHDPYVSFWEEFNLNISQDFNCFDEETNIVIFTTGHAEYKNNKNLIANLNNQENLYIYDTIGILSEDEISFLSKKHVVKVLGRGDI